MMQINMDVMEIQKHHEETAVIYSLQLNHVIRVKHI